MNSPIRLIAVVILLGALLFASLQSSTDLRLAPRLLVVDGTVIYSDSVGAEFDGGRPLLMAGVDSLALFIVSLDEFDRSVPCGVASSFWLTCSLDGHSLIVDSAVDIVDAETQVYGLLFRSSEEPVGKVMVGVHYMGLLKMLFGSE